MLICHTFQVYMPSLNVYLDELLSFELFLAASFAFLFALFLSLALIPCNAFNSITSMGLSYIEKRREQTGRIWKSRQMDEDTLFINYRTQIYTYKCAHISLYSSSVLYASSATDIANVAVIQKCLNASREHLPLGH